MFIERIVVPTRSELREATRLRVLDSARRLFEARGFNATTVRAIAADAGVSAGTVMTVGDKRTLLVKVFDEAIGAVHASRAFRAPDGESATRDAAAVEPVESATPDGSAAGPVPPETLAAQVTDLLEPFISLFAAHPDLSRAYAAALISGAHASEVFGGLRTLLIAEIASVLSRAAGGDAGSRVDADALAASIHLLYIGAVFEWATGTERDAGALASRIREALPPLMPALQKDRS